MGGTKTDLEVAQSADLTTKILSDGTVVNYLRIKRHNASAEKNRDYMRVLVPLNSELISIEGVEDGLHLKSLSESLMQDQDLELWDRGELKWNKVFVRTESGKTEFASWFSTNPGQSREVLFVYQLPFKIKTGFFNSTPSYGFLLQKQNGGKPYEFHQHLSAEALIPYWTTPNVLVDEEVDFASSAETDNYWAAVFKNE